MKEFESQFMKIYFETKKKIPGLHHLDFYVTTYDHSGKTELSGFILIHNDCNAFDSIIELETIISKYEILFRRFS
uniref:Uncharacterized protein n=1 Tax=viral metagenome TaxID=1070528 RepID=A0A6M3XYB3_9ZZZZ